MHSAGGRVFVSLYHYSPLVTPRLAEVNIATGAYVIRTEADNIAGHLTELHLLGLADGRLVVVPEAYLEPAERLLYSPGTDSFTRPAGLLKAWQSPFSVSPSGRSLMGSVVFDAALDSVAAVRGTQDWLAGGAALSADGTAVYLATKYGYTKMRLSDWTVLEQGKLPIPPVRLIAVPDGSRLIAVGVEWTPRRRSGVMIVDLR